MVLQIAYNNSTDGGQSDKDWGAAFLTLYKGSIVLISARHVLSRSKLADPLHVLLREPGSQRSAAWRGLVYPLIHPKADLVVFQAPAGLPSVPLRIATAPAAPGDTVEVPAVPNVGLALDIGPITRLKGTVTAISPVSTTGRFSEQSFVTTLPGAPGTSGAPVLNASGEVVGLYSRQNDPRGSSTVCVTLDGLADLL